MNTFWLKIAAFAVVVVAVIILISVFTSNEQSQLGVEPANETKTKPKTFYDKAEEDKQRFLTEPRPLEELAEKPAAKPEEQLVKQQPVVSPQVKVQEQNQPPTVLTTQPAQPAVVEPNVVKPQPTTLYFSPLSEIDEIEAERLLNIAVSGRSIGRLPQTGFQLMVQTCRQIISKWPDSWYAYNAQKMLIDMPQRFRERYNITQEELDISAFTKQRPGTEPYSGAAGEVSP